MSYLDVFDMTRSGTLSGRMSAAAAQEQTSGATLDPVDPEAWVAVNRWALVSAPGWGDAWASAGASGNADPGSDPGVITDGMILSQVQAVIPG
jgi:hypothetical protein